MDGKGKVVPTSNRVNVLFPNHEERGKQILWDQGKEWANFDDLDLGFQ